MKRGKQWVMRKGERVGWPGGPCGVVVGAEGGGGAGSSESSIHRLTTVMSKPSQHLFTL